jgi:hypothetical protein
MMRVGILFTSGKRLNDRITSLGEEVWFLKTNITPQPFIEIHVSRQVNEWSCICMLGVSIRFLFLRYVY